MKKTYVLDTSTLIYDPLAFEKLCDSHIIIPIAVLMELDKLKRGIAESSRNARVAIKILDEISNRGNMSNNIPLENGNTISVDTQYFTELGFGDISYGDTQILCCAHNHCLAGNDITVISNDINLRVKCRAFGIKAQACEKDKHNLNDLYSGSQIIENEEAGLLLQKEGFINPNDYGFDLHPNECVLFQSSDQDGIAMGRQVSHDKIKLVRKFHPWGISSRNKEQTFAIDMIMDKNIDLITLIGRAGTGKSLVALASATELVLNKREYDKFILYRPIQPVGNDIGFLPGTMEEKLAPWFQALMDNFELLFTTKNNGDWKKDLELYQKRGRIEIQAITYIRGRSIPNAIILVDEAQNLTRGEIKTILTRVGENTKIILTGDIEQIDNQNLDATNNGLVHAIESFKNSDIAGHITCTQGERSRLAALAADIL